jgi:hypothetical protein
MLPNVEDYKGEAGMEAGEAFSPTNVKSRLKNRFRWDKWLCFQRKQKRKVVAKMTLRWR